MERAYHTNVEILLNAALSGLEIIQKNLYTQVDARKKDDGSLVSSTDLLANEEIISILEEAFPGVPIHSEEKPYSGSLKDGAIIVVDPLDGTTNFTRAISLCSVSIALLEYGDPKIGVVTPLAGEMYFAEKGKGSFSMHSPGDIGYAKRLQCAKRPLSDAILSVSADFNDQLSREIWWKWMERLKPPTCYRLRILESAAIELCWVASGKIDGYLHPTDKPWDTAAGALISAEAGVQLKGPELQQWSIIQEGIVAASESIIKSIEEVLNEGRRIEDRDKK